MSKKIGPRITISLKPEQVSFLNAESERTGASVAELVRRAVNLLAFGEAQAARQPALERVAEALNVEPAFPFRRPQVLIPTKASE